MNNKLVRFTVVVGFAFACVANAPLAQAANSIAFLVADAGGDPYGLQPGLGQVDAFDSSGAYLGAVVTGLTVPTSLTIGPSGYLYVANHNTGPNNGQVLAYDPNNNFALVNSGGITSGVFASGLNGPGGLLASGNTIYVSELGDIPTATPFQGNLIKHYDAGGTLISETNNPLSSGAGQTGLAGMAMDADGSLYAAAFIGGGSGDVIKFDHIAASTAYATPPSIFATPAPGASAILFHGGDLYVTEQLAGAVAAYDSTGNLISATAGLAFPSGLFDLGNGNMLISESGNGFGASGQVDIYNFATADLTSGFITGTGVEGSIFQPLSVIAVPEPTGMMLSLIGLPILLASLKARRRRAVL